jgi:predicted dehydrogenase
VHYQLAMIALEQGIPTFIEKPFCCNIRQGNNLLYMSGKLSTPIYVGNILRYFPAMQNVRFLIQTGAIGDVQNVSACRMTDKRDYIRKWWKALDRFLLLYEGIHTIDWLNTICSYSEISICKSELYYDLDDFSGDRAFNVRYILNQKIDVSLKHDMVSLNSINKISIKGSKGGIEVVDFHKIFLNQELIAESSFDQSFNSALTLQVGDYISSILGAETYLCTGYNALPAISIIDKLYNQSVKSKRS